MKKRFIVIFILLIMCFTISVKAANNITINNPNQESQKLRVLVIEINPILNSITNTQLYGNENNGHPYASDFIYYQEYKNNNMSLYTPLNEMIKDIQDMSHGYIKIETKIEKLNEFPKWKVKVKLKNGTYSYLLDEETYISQGRVENTDYGDWRNLLNSSFWSDSTAYQFDYDYLINKFDLVNRRNNNEFDQVWIYSIDPFQGFETVMIGRDGERFWVNGETDKGYDCDAFFMPTISMVRRDANLHAFGHGVEGILQMAFGVNVKATLPQRYIKNYFQITNETEYNKLNLWDRYTLTSHNNSGNISSVGIIHYPFNGTSDYDYSNKTKVMSNWEDWENYPNFKNEWKEYDSSAWINHPINTSLGVDENKDPDRLYSRLWFYLMPHINGYYTDGHVNNWWRYIVSLDFVMSIKNNISNSLQTTVGNKVAVDYTLNYNSKSTTNMTSVFEGDNVTISNPSVVKYVDGVLYANAVGTTNITIYYDGREITYNLTVKAGDNKVPVYKLENLVVNVDKKLLVINSVGTKVQQLFTTTENNSSLEIFNKDDNLLYSNSKTDSSTILSTGQYVTYHVSNIQLEKYLIAVKGDVSGDGKINSLDYVRIKNHIMGSKTIEGNEFIEAADYNNDNKISSLDYVKIKNYIMSNN